MSDEFEVVLLKQDKPTGIRKQLSTIGFEYCIHNGRHAAKCLYCGRIVTNTGYKRLNAHRDNCSLFDPHTSPTGQFKPDSSSQQSSSNDSKSKLSEAGFEKFLHNGRNAAKCTYCGTIVTNTGYKRLNAHRSICMLTCPLPTQTHQPEETTNDSEYDESFSLPKQPEVKSSRRRIAVDGFESCLRNGRNAAKCIYCGTIVTNTGHKRLNSHRDNCSELFPLTTSNRKMLKESISSHSLEDSYRLSDNVSNEVATKKTTILGFKSCLHKNRNAAKCLYCGKIMTNTAYKRLNAHREICVSSHENLTPPANSAVKRSRESPSTIVLVDRCTAEDQAYLERKLADFFHNCGIPFTAVEHYSCVELLNALRPAFKVPSEDELMAALVDDTELTS